MRAGVKCVVKLRVMHVSVIGEVRPVKHRQKQLQLTLTLSTKLKTI